MFEDNKRLFVRITHSERHSAVYSERSEESNFYNIDNYHKYFGWLQQCLKLIKDSSFVSLTQSDTVLSILSAAKNIVYIIFITTANILNSYSKLGR